MALEAEVVERTVDVGLRTPQPYRMRKQMCAPLLTSCGVHAIRVPLKRMC